MASSSSSFRTPSFFSQSWKYHVFLSFNGGDTRKTFVDHLYSALEQQGIYTYKDGETLPRGESIGPSLMKAIEESHIALIIFSKNYADSSWCLDELACIMKCKDRKSQIVMPIFYDVSPSEVRKQKPKYGEAFTKHELENKYKIKSWKQTLVDDPWGWFSAPREQNLKYKEAFAKHELENKTRLESWRKALVDASEISGWELKNIANGHEAKVIKEIVEQISQRLQLVIPSANANLVGIAARLQDLKWELQIGSGGVRMVGIWGIGGGGKTTLASSMYDEISWKFDGCCFVGNIREESSKNGLEKLQEKILCGILKKKQVPVGRVEEGKRMIMGRLCRRKVLIVLDDVDCLDQLRALAGSHDWFGEGSRIIITTRDEHLLTSAHRVDVIHNISLLNDDEAMELFSKHAPRGHKCAEDYELLSKDVVSYSGGLPLALTVLGCFLCDKDINEWRSALARLKKIPDTDIVEKLKISFDGLKFVEKELFLDIACFFRRQYKDERIMAMLDACGFYPTIGIKVLIQKALITITEDGRFDMHDLVQEMGHHIVRREYPNNPGKHSRVWEMKDVLKIRTMDATTELDVIEAIRVESNRYDPIKFLPSVFVNMKNLRWIDWIDWNSCDLASPFPTNFPSVELCYLRLDSTLQKQLWKGYKHLPNLKMMELYRLQKLIMTPDFDGLPNLETFILRNSPHIEEIHPSIQLLESLAFLSIEDCPSLKICPSLAQLNKLKTLSVSDCPKLLEIQQQNMNKLPHLHLDNSGKEVATRKKLLTKFSVICWTCGGTQVKKPQEDLIDLKECCLEETFSPHNNMHHQTLLGFFPKGIRSLNLWYCNLGDRHIDSAVWELPNLEKLNLGGNNFSRLNFSLLRLPRLKWLNVSGCKKLVELSELPSSIAVLRADWCTSLESFGDVSNCKWLRKVSLREGNKLSPLVGDILLHSMLQGIALEDHFISVTLDDKKVPEGFVGRLFSGKTFTLDLPNDWYNEFCGFLICIVTNIISPRITITIKQEPDEGPPSSSPPSELLMQESNEYDHVKKMFIGYVSFGSLSHTTLSTSSYNIISFSLDREDGISLLETDSYVGAQLVPRKHKGDDQDQVETTKVPAADCLGFWDEFDGQRQTFRVQHDSQSSIKILWQPYYCPQKVVVKVDSHNLTELILMAIANLPGVQSIAINRKDKEVTVIGEVDTDDVIKTIRKYYKVVIVTVGPAAEGL